jgi:putative insertion element HTH domain-containing protein
MMGSTTPRDDEPRSAEVGVAEVIRLTDATGPAATWLRRTSVQKAAALLLPELIDERLVDRVLDLAEGTTRRWLDEDEEFRDRVVSRRLSLQSQRDPDIDYARALTAKQTRAGFLLIEEEMTQTKVAEVVGVDPRTIRNWHHQRAFQGYLEVLAEQRAARLKQEALAERAAVRAGDRRVRQKALGMLEKQLDAGDRKAAEMVFKLLIDR